MNELPSGAWVVIGFLLRYTLDLIGFILKSIYNHWKLSKLPSESDKRRYDAVMESINPDHFYYFITTPPTSIGSRAIDNIEDCYEHILSIRKTKPMYNNKKLQALEDSFLSSLEGIIHILPYYLFPKKINPNVLTIFPDGNKNEQFKSHEREIVEKINEIINNYNKFRDEGNKIFQTKITQLHA